MPAVIFTWNPERWAFEDGEWEAARERTEAGGTSDDQWSVGRRRSIPVGQRAFLLRQGAEPRGIVASGWTRGEVFEDEGFDDQSPTARYVEVRWDTVLEQDDPLPTEVLLADVSQVSWNYMQSSGNDITDDAMAKVDDLWAAHVARSLHRPAPGTGQGRAVSPRARGAIEDYAQQLLEEHFRDDGWDVTDTRIGHPYDAIARRGDELRYLEAKGTQGAGTSVFVTAGEVEFAVDHPGECVMGIVSGIKLSADDDVVQGSGTLELLDWTPHDEDLAPVTLTWTPPRS